MGSDQPVAWVVHANATINGVPKLVTVRCKQPNALFAAELAIRELHRLGAQAGDVQSLSVTRA